MRFIIFAVLVLFIMASCNSTKKLRASNNNCTKMDTTNFKILNGNYSSDLWNYFAPFKKYGMFSNTKNQLSDKSMHVNLCVINNKTIKVSLIKNDSIIGIKKIKGRVKNNYFSVREKVRVVGFPFIFLIYYSNKMDMSLTNKNELYVAIDETKMGMCAFYIGGGDDSFFKIYKRK